MTQKSLLHAVAAQIANGYETAEVPMYSEQLRMPDRKVIIKIIENLQKVFFPAYFAGGTVSHVSAETFAEFLLGEIYTDLCEQVHLAFSNTIKDEAELRERTSAVCDRFLCRLPQIQAMLMKDVAANFDGDPAAGSKEEVIFSYPGLYAIFVYRVAHELYESKVPLIPRIMSEYAHGATGTAFFIWFAFQMPKNGTGWVFRILFLVAAMISVKPLQTWVWGESQAPSAVENKAVSHVEFKKVKSEAELQQALAENNKPLVMLDLYADWCVACKEFEKETFSDQSVQKAFGDMLLLQIDMTKNSEENRALMTKYKVLGLPTILFFNRDGKEIEGSRVNGFMPPVEFLQWIEKISKA